MSVHDDGSNGLHTLPCHAYLLAAGRGRRAGGPKAWREHEGLSLLERQVMFVTGLLEPQAIAIAIQADWVERCRALHTGVHWVPVDPDRPPLASLLTLFGELPLGRWGFVWHVDMPLWHRPLFNALFHYAERAAPKVDAIVPTFDGRGGHPVLLAPRAAASLTRLDPQHDRLDHWLHEHETVRLAVPEAVIHANWNRPAS
jgi:molybdopterin-guanine dinucleotide biosynthesis protein A